MNLDHYILASMRRAAADVFATMVGLELAPGEERDESAAPESPGGVVSFIGVAGAWAGTGSLTCSPILACRISSRMLAVEISSINEDVLDAMAELTNMIIGSVKNDLEGRLGPLGLSIPTVVYGRNFHTRSANANQWNVVRFPFDKEQLLVKLCLSPIEPRLGERTGIHGLHPAGQDGEQTYAFRKVDG